MVKSSRLSQPWALSHCLGSCFLILMSFLWVSIESWGWAPMFMESRKGSGLPCGVERELNSDREMEETLPK